MAPEEIGNHSILANGPRCQDWNGDLGVSPQVDLICHGGYVLLGLAFILPSLIPVTYDTFAMRTLLTSSAIVFVLWAKFYICAVDILLWNIAILVINLAYTLLLIKRHFPVGVPRDLREVYMKVFVPFKMSKRQFREVTRGSSQCFLQRSEVLFFEQSSRRQSSRSLSILLSGRLSVKYEGVVISKIKPYEFIDSVEFASYSLDERRRSLESGSHQGLTDVSDNDVTYQVTVEADDDSIYLKLNHEDLFNLSEDTQTILDLLVGKDVSLKLYHLSDFVAMAKDGADEDDGAAKLSSRQRRPRRDKMCGGLRVLDFHRTVSLDAMDTGCKGYVRSIDWINKSERAKKETLGDERVLILNFELDVPPTMDYLPHDVPVNTMDKSTLAEAQFLAQQRKYWPSGFI